MDATHLTWGEAILETATDPQTQGPQQGGSTMGLGAGRQAEGWLTVLRVGRKGQGSLGVCMGGTPGSLRGGAAGFRKPRLWAHLPQLFLCLLEPHLPPP